MVKAFAEKTIAAFLDPSSKYLVTYCLENFEKKDC